MAKQQVDFAIMPVNREAFSVPEFCFAHNICRATLFNLLKAGAGPKLLKVGRRSLITADAAREWRERLVEQGTAR